MAGGLDESRGSLLSGPLNLRGCTTICFVGEAFINRNHRQRHEKRYINKLMEVHLSEQEREQILQTIQMFELITQAQPDDYQSYDVLKEAYLKLGREADALDAARKLADSYLKLGQYSSALLECEGILQRNPSDAQALALMGDLESRMQEASGKTAASTASGSVDEANPSLVATTATKRGTKAKNISEALADSGNESFAKFLIDNQFCDENAIRQALQIVHEKYAMALAGGELGPSLLEEIEILQPGTTDSTLSALVDATRFAYIPLEIYDVDRQIVKMLPESLTMTRRIVPFDLISRTLLVAVCNPFDGDGKEAAQHELDYNIQWFLAKPEVMAKVLKDVYRK